MEPLGLEMLDPLPTRNLLQDVMFFVLAVGRNDVCNRTAQHFLRAKAEDSLHALVPTDDDALEVFAHNPVIRGIDDGGKKSLGRRKESRCVGRIRRMHQKKPSTLIVLPGAIALWADVLFPFRMARGCRMGQGCSPAFCDAPGMASDCPHREPSAIAALERRPGALLFLAVRTRR